MLLEVNLVSRMDTAILEHSQKVRKQIFMKSIDRLPAIKKFSSDKHFTKSCAFKEFKFETPYDSHQKELTRNKLPPISEQMLPKRHNSFNEDGTDVIFGDLQPLPSFSISPAFITDKNDSRSVSVETPAKSPGSYLFNSREFTFPGSSAKRWKQFPSQPNIVPALTPRVRDMPRQAKMEKLAKLKQKERAKRAIERRYERKPQYMTDIPVTKSHMAFKTRREPDISSLYASKEHKCSPFKQMVRIHEETDKNRCHPRLYTRILDSIHSYTKGSHETNIEIDQRGSYERLVVTPVTVKEDVKSDASTPWIYLPPIT